MSECSRYWDVGMDHTKAPFLIEFTFEYGETPNIQMKKQFQIVISAMMITGVEGYWGLLGS